MNREQEAIERMAKAIDQRAVDYAYRRVDSPPDGRTCARVALDALLAPSPCPTCGGTGLFEVTNHDPLSPKMADVGPCPDCTDGTVPPLLRWNEEA